MALDDIAKKILMLAVIGLCVVLGSKFLNQLLTKV